MSEPNKDIFNTLDEKANSIRKLIIEMLSEAKSGHPGGSLGMSDVFAAMYFYILNHQPQNPLWEDRDRLILSNGHICPAQYSSLALAGYFDIRELKSLRKINSRLQGHPHRGSLPGLETSSGPLGEGLSQACGIALAAKIDGKKHRVYCLTSDGEHQEGNTWEAVMFAAKYKLGNLIEFIDRNNTQISGFTEQIMPLESLSNKYKSFGWHVQDINGNNMEEIIKSVAIAKTIQNQPSCIVAHTITGKGVSFLENDFHSHDRVISDNEAKIALKELNAKS